MGVLTQIQPLTGALALEASGIPDNLRKKPAMLPAVLVILIILGLILQLWRTRSRLSHIPGPFWASISNIPRVWWVWGRNAHRIHIGLHEKYGKLVRLGPNMVSVGDPNEIAQIYGFTGKFKKSDFYSVILPMSKGRILPGMFATQDEKIHSILKKPIASVYSMSNLVSFEPYVNSTMQVFCEQLDARFADRGQICDFSTWLQYFAFDVVGEITFSKRLGFLETGEDVENIMSDIWKFFQYVALACRLERHGSVCTGEAAGERAAREIREPAATNSKDFLSRFLAAREKDPSIPDWAVLAWTQSNITAGSDTTAIFLRTLFYNLLRHPDTLEKLMTELDDARREGKLSEVAAWHQARTLPYLDACIKEAGRIHPPFGMPLERVVPPEGATICGEFIKGGTIVGMNGWVVHRSAEFFGPDADVWNPDRWLCEDIEKRKAMDRGLLTFGAGHRSCIGKNISQLEIYKLVPTLLQRYEITLADPGTPWNLQNRWFVPQFDFNVKLTRRGEKELI
ncbi:hypothetical protein H2199_001898 [Coniosporium tulheliwenetii]|uniref:Uncharacterized protein n=1 Tax=Coniosporium tulheliwenetii TaxID=3383036 RepID=A0ACC2ZKN9_9PEZI|nr:hypothetical protein H2199_001898 [Cladosporium sp. JES 115]